MEPITVVTALGLLGGGVTALWKIANGMGRFEGRIAKTIEGVDKTLSGIDARLQDHETRIRKVEING